MLPRLQQRLEHFDIEQVVLTVMDSDTLLHRRYLEYIAHDFCQLDDAKRYSAIWQAALFYNWDLGKAYFFTRITALFRTIWMIGFNIPFQVHSMSVYSTSLRLCIDNGYFDPTYQMEDMHFYVSSMNTRRGRIKLRAVYLPVICGPTSGADWKDELHEWQRQAQRWSIGAFEVFHYICTKTSSRGFFVAARLALTMVLLYGIFQSIIFFATLIAIPAWHGYQMTSDLQLWHLMTVSPWLFMGWVFLVDYIYVRRYGLQRERVGWLRNIWHLILTPLVLLSYNAVSFLALHILVVRGKAVCAHDPSEKSCLTAE